jgi:hypothetical protein
MPKGVYKRIQKPWNTGKGIPEIDRILNLVQKGEPTACWIFTGSKDKDGYGLLTGSGHKVIRVPRYVYWYYNLKDKGIILNREELVCHTCDNPSCCNPEHLFIGSNLDNMQDCKSKNRLNTAKGENHGISKLTEEQVLEIYNSNEKQKKLSEKYGVTFQAVSNIQRGKTWSWLTKHREKGVKL